MPDLLPRRTEVEYRPLDNMPAYRSYVRLMDSRGYHLSLHDAASNPGEYWVSSQN